MRWLPQRPARLARRYPGVILLLGAALLLVAALVGRALIANNDTARADVADDVVQLADLRPTDPAAVARGRYVAVASDCAACHTDFAHRGAPYAGGHELKTPFGTIVATNVTPDRETGIGTWTERDFFRAIRHGRGKGTLRYLYPAMPYTAYAKLGDRDVHDLWAYMATVPPVRASVEANRLPFPFNIRLLMAGWNLMFFDNRGFADKAGENPALRRGRYLVDGPGHCAGCHTPKNLLGGDKSGRYLEGGLLQGWFAPEITGDRQQGLGGWSRDDVVAYLRDGSNRQGVASGPMAEAVEHSTQHLTPADLAAMAAYLKSLPGSRTPRPVPLAVDDPVMRRGRHLYDVNCTACHGRAAEGLEGLTPAFADNPAVRAHDPSSLLHVLMVGGRAAASARNPTSGGMPSFAWKLDDADMAAVLTYLRNANGNAAAAVTPAQAARMRKELGAAHPVGAP